MHTFLINQKTILSNLADENKRSCLHLFFVSKQSHYDIMCMDESVCKNNIKGANYNV